VPPLGEPPGPPYTLRCSIILKRMVYSLLEPAYRLWCRLEDCYIARVRVGKRLGTLLHSRLRLLDCVVCE